MEQAHHLLLKKVAILIPEPYWSPELPLARGRIQDGLRLRHPWGPAPHGCRGLTPGAAPLVSWASPWPGPLWDDTSVSFAPSGEEAVGRASLFIASGSSESSDEDRSILDPAGLRDK